MINGADMFNKKYPFLITITPIEPSSCRKVYFCNVNDQYDNLYQVKVESEYKHGQFTLRLSEEQFNQIDWVNTTQTIDLEDYWVQEYKMDQLLWEGFIVTDEIICKPEYYEEGEDETKVYNRIKKYLWEKCDEEQSVEYHISVNGPFTLDVLEAP